MLQFFVNQHKALNLIVVLVLVLGTLTFITGQKEGYPAVGLDAIRIDTIYVGASSDSMEQLVTKPIEDAILPIDGAESIHSHTSAGHSIIVFEVDDDSGIPISSLLRDIQAAVKNVKLPALAEEPIVQELRFGTWIVNIVAGFVGDVDNDVLKGLADRFSDDVKEIHGVGRVELINEPQISVKVKVDAAALKHHELTLPEIITRIKTRNFNVPAGKVTVDNKEFFIKTKTSYQSLDEIRNTIIRGNDKGQHVQLRDVATVQWEYQEIAVQRRVEGKQGVWVRIYKKPDGDIITISKNVKQLLADYETRKLLPAGVQTLTTDDNSFYVKRRLSILSSNATIGLGLVFLCMVLFFNLRVTLLTILGIPFSFCMAIIIMYQMGLTLNMMTMFGFIVVVGMLVDDTIIVAENIYFYREQGYSYYKAAIMGTQEMVVPILGIVLTTILGFMQTSNLPGFYGEMIQILAQAMIITLFCSLFECLLILPGHLAHLKDTTTSAKKDSDVRSSLLARFSTLSSKFHALFYYIAWVHCFTLRVAIRYPKITLSSFVLIMIGLVAFILPRLPVIYFPESPDKLTVSLEIPSESSLKQMSAVADTVEAALRAELPSKSVVELISTIGQSSGRFATIQSYLGYVTIYFDPAREESEYEMNKKVAQIMDEVQTPTKLVSFTTEEHHGGTQTERPLDLSISGKDMDTLTEAAETIANFMRELPNTTSVYINTEASKTELNVLPDPELADLLGVNIPLLAGTLQNSFSETNVVTLNELSRPDGYTLYDNEVELVVEYTNNSTNDDALLEQLPLRTDSYQLVPLTRVATIEKQENSGQIIKRDGEIFISVSAYLENPENIQYNENVLVKKIEEQFSTWQAAYTGIALKMRGERERQDELNRGILKTLLLICFSIYLLLTIIFRSYIQPLLVLSIIPLSYVGALIGLYTTNTALGFMPFMGGLALVGIIVNDSLILVKKLNEVRVENPNMDLKIAVLKGTEARLRPILMTSLTTIVGILPQAYGFAGKEPFLEPMAITLMWGLLISTPLLLIFLPAIYVLTDNISNSSRRQLKILGQLKPRKLLQH